MVAGVAPSSRTARSISRAKCKFCGRGNPCVSTVDSSATTGRFPFTASTTSLNLSKPSAKAINNVLPGYSRNGSEISRPMFIAQNAIDMFNGLFDVRRHRFIFRLHEVNRLKKLLAIFQQERFHRIPMFRGRGAFSLLDDLR